MLLVACVSIKRGFIYWYDVGCKRPRENVEMEYTYFDLHSNDPWINFSSRRFPIKHLNIVKYISVLMIVCATSVVGLIKSVSAGRKMSTSEIIKLFRLQYSSEYASTVLSRFSDSSKALAITRYTDYS